METDEPKTGIRIPYSLEMVFVGGGNTSVAGGYLVVAYCLLEYAMAYLRRER